MPRILKDPTKSADEAARASARARVECGLSITVLVRDRDAVPLSRKLIVGSLGDAVAAERLGRLHLGLLTDILRRQVRLVEESREQNEV